MYLRITNARFDPSRYDEVVSLAQEVSAAVSSLAGFQHYYGGLDRTAGTVAAVSVWDTEEQARFSRDALGDIMSRLQAVGLQLEPPQIYEIVTES